MQTYSVIHVDSGEEVNGNFTSEMVAYEWLEQACKFGELEPSDMEAYVVERNEND